MIESDAAQLAKRIAEDFPSLPNPVEPDWLKTNAAKVIECVLSLRKPYESVVKPRVIRFAEENPSVKDCADLRALVSRYINPEEFIVECLNLNSPVKASMIVGVTEYLLDIQGRFEGITELEKLTAWANWSRPGDHLMMDVRGFKLAGFQYLRMLFGAETIKPDVHILNYAGEVLGRVIEPGRAKPCV